MDELGIVSPVDIAAWSYGALTTLDYALDNQERIRSLILIEPPAMWVLHKSNMMDTAALENEKMLSTLSGDITEKKLEEFLCAVGFCPPGQQARNLPQWPIWLQYRQALRNSPAVIAHTDELSRLQSFQKPVLLVKGTGSATFLHQIIEILAERLPHARVTEMPAGHAPHIVSMDTFLSQMKAFQESVA